MRRNGDGEVKRVKSKLGHCRKRKTFAILYETGDVVQLLFSFCLVGGITLLHFSYAGQHTFCSPVPQRLLPGDASCIQTKQCSHFDTGDCDTTCWQYSVGDFRHFLSVYRIALGDKYCCVVHSSQE